MLQQHLNAVLMDLPGTVCALKNNTLGNHCGDNNVEKIIDERLSSQLHHTNCFWRLHRNVLILETYLLLGCSLSYENLFIV